MLVPLSVIGLLLEDRQGVDGKDLFFVLAIEIHLVSILPLFSFEPVALGLQEIHQIRHVSGLHHFLSTGELRLLLLAHLLAEEQDIGKQLFVNDTGDLVAALAGLIPAEVFPRRMQDELHLLSQDDLHHKKRLLLNKRPHSN